MLLFWCVIWLPWEPECFLQLQFQWGQYICFGTMCLLIWMWCKNLSLDCMVVISSFLFMLKELCRKGKGKLEVPFLSESEVCMICYHSCLSRHPNSHWRGWYVFWDNDVIPGTIFLQNIETWKISKLCFIYLLVEKVRSCRTFVVWLSTTTSLLNSIRFAIAACASLMMSCHFVWCEKLCRGENVKTCAVN